jgi:hypothetical protein
MPLYLLKPPKFMNRVQLLAAKLVRDLESERLERDPANNIQTLWAKFKVDIITYGKHCSRFITDDTTRKIRTWKAQLNIVLHDQDMATEDRSLAAYILEQKIADQLREHSEQKKQVSEARYDVEGENLRTNSWTRSAKGYHTKESIMEFKVEEGSYSEAPRYETRPKPMAQMARDYHDSYPISCFAR